GSTATNQVGIWEDGTGTLLSSVTVGPANPSATLAVPLVLTAGKRYVVGVRETSASPSSNGRVATGLPSFLVLDDSAYNRSSTFSYPNLRDNQTGPIKLAEDLSITFGAPDSAPLVAPGAVTALQATAGDGRVDLTWTNPTGAFDRVRIVRK